MKSNTLTEIIALLFVILFLYAGISKWMDYTVFKEQIALSPVLRPFSDWIAWLLPLTECIVAVLLFIPDWRLKGLYGALFLMVIFNIYIGAILLLDDHLPCSCGGIIEWLSWKGHLAFNGIFTGLAIGAVLLEKKKHRSDRSAPLQFN